jgi:4,5-dihydroxyphthalate decarboxylase
MPAFPSRVFRHSMVYVNTDADIEKTEDLNGKRIAVLEWGMTAVVWIIGIMCEEYGLDLTSVDWVAAIKPRVPIQLPSKVAVRYIDADRNISDMLESGEIDAAFLHQVPACFAKGSARVKRMFPDFKSAEIEYYRRTGIHPIMHCIVMRKDIFQQHPWALRSLYKAFCAARQKVVEALNDNGALCAMIPFLPSVIEETRQIFGPDFWPYGLKANRNVLEKLITYAYQQGLTPRMFGVEELFAENVAFD